MNFDANHPFGNLSLRLKRIAKVGIDRQKAARAKAVASPNYMGAIQDYPQQGFRRGVPVTNWSHSSSFNFC